MTHKQDIAYLIKIEKKTHLNATKIAENVLASLKKNV